MSLHLSIINEMNTKGFLCFIALILTLCACDDNTSTLGVDMMPNTDLVTKEYVTYDVTTESYAVGDSVLARTSHSYLGRFTDPETGTTNKSDFMAQFNCSEQFSFPDSIEGDSCTSAELKLYIDKYVGDTLASFKLSVYELNKALDPTEEYYTNINTSKYYDSSAQPIATKWFSISDRTITDSLRWTSSYLKNIRIALPHTVGTEIIKGYREHPEYFESTYTWANSGLPCSKGFYFKLESGDGAMAYIDIAQFNLYFRYYDSEYEKDTTGVCQFSATDEVVEATHFENSNLDKLLEDESSTYLRTPAGIFTMATIPAEMINTNDTLNSAKIIFTRYNDKVESNFKLGIPQNVLMVRLDDYLNGFFENYKIVNNKTSYITTFNSKNNSYTFDNIARLVSTMVQEKKEGKASPNWNKVLLIPVSPTKDSSGNIVNINHDFSMGSARLVGGKNDKVKMEVIYSKFRQ